VVVAVLKFDAMDRRAWLLLRTTLQLAAATCLLAVPPGVFLAWLLARTDVPGRRAASAAILATLFVPLYLTVAAWQAGFGMFGWATAAWYSGPWLSGFAGAVWVHAMAAIPWIVLIAGIGLRGVEAELEEQALLDGSPAAVFRRVTLPAAAPAIGAAALWVAVVVAGEMTVTDLFDVRTFAEEIYTASRFETANPSIAAGMVLVALAVAAGVAVAYRLGPARRPLGRRPAMVFALGRWRWPAAAFVAIVLFALLALPLGNLVYQAGSVVRDGPEGRHRGWSAAKCGAMVGGSPYLHRREIGWSTLLGATAAPAGVAAAAAAAWWARQRLGRSRLLWVCVGVSAAVPGPVLGLTTIALLNRPEIPGLVWLYDQSILAPWLVAVFRGFGPAALVLAHAMRSVPEELVESATLDGAGPLRRFLHLAVLGRFEAVAAAWLMVFAWTIGELAGTILVAPAGMTTLATRVFGLLHGGAYDQLAGLCLLLWCVCGVVTAVVARLLDAGRR
jgi:iron(III) transport system permease protein